MDHVTWMIAPCFALSNYLIHQPCVYSYRGSAVASCSFIFSKLYACKLVGEVFLALPCCSTLPVWFGLVWFGLVWLQHAHRLLHQIDRHLARGPSARPILAILR